MPRLTVVVKLSAAFAWVAVREALCEFVSRFSVEDRVLEIVTVPVAPARVKVTSVSEAVYD